MSRRTPDCIDEDRIEALLAGRLSSERADAIEAHVEDCIACKQRVARWAAAKMTDRTAPPMTENTRADAHKKNWVGWLRSHAGALLAPGTALGRYVVLQPVGEGGMGVVYAAYDPELDRKVALKLLRPLGGAQGGAGGTSREHRERLLREARAIAKLSHPNVVVVHDVGTFDERVFVAMEFVDGETLREWMERVPRSARELRDVFVAAGRGLAAAHAAGLVHRDFKPDNVLVGKDGRVRVTDFGLARPPELGPGDDTDPTPAPPASQQDLAALADAHAPTVGKLTETGAVAGTPAYMAPEQHAARATDARTDQFSFCVALYEALYGARPFVARAGETLSEVVCDGRVEPAPKGSSVPARVRALLLRGLSVRPDDRFASMNALLAELERDPDARRRRWGNAALAVVALAGVGALGARLARREPLCTGAERALDGAWDADRRRAIGAAFEASGAPYAKDAELGVSRALDAYAAGWVKMRTEACEATRVRGVQSDETLTARNECLDRRLAEVRALTDVLARADRGVVERSVQASSELTPLDACADPALLSARVRPPESAAIRKQAEALAGEIEGARGLERAGKFADARASARALVPRVEALHHRPLEADALLLLARVELHAGDPSAAIGAFERAASAAEAGRHDEAAAEAWAELVGVFGNGTRFEDAERAAVRAAAAIERLGGAGTAPIVLANGLGDLEFAKGHYAAAAGHHREALTLAEQRLGADHLQVAETALFLANDLREDAKYEEAMPHYERSLALRERWLGPEHPYVASTLNGLGIAQRYLGRPADARRTHERALAIREKALGPEHPAVGDSLVNLATTLIKQDDARAALPLVVRALPIYERVYGGSSSQFASAWQIRGQAEEQLGELDIARASFERCLSIREKLLGASHPTVAITLGNLGHVALAKGDARAALEAYARALAIEEAAFGTTHANLAYDLAGIGRAHLAASHAELAIAPLERAVALRAAANAPAAKQGEVELLLARALLASGRDRARATDLAKSARDKLDGKARQEADAFLRDHAHDHRW